MTAPAAQRPDTLTRRTLRVYRWAIGMGWPESQAVAWAAWCAGIPLVDGERPLGPWTLRELRGLLLLRARYSQGHWQG